MATPRMLLVLFLIVASGCASPQGPSVGTLDVPVDSARLLDDLRYLADPSLEGRATGTAGNALARDYIVRALQEAGVEPAASGDWEEPFAIPSVDGTALGGVNLLGIVRGTERPDRYIVLTAHYDHLGRRDGVVFPGADDNASGTAALLEIARQLRSDPPRSSVIVAALDAEELGLRGARAFVDSPPVPLADIVLNMNMDMVGRSDAGELHVAGTYHYPFLEPLIDELAASADLTLRKGHDRPDGSAGDDWTTLSDHGAFHAAGVPFLYFGVEDHADYHRPTDTFAGIQPGFHVAAVRTVLDALRLADERLDEIERAAGR